MSNALRSKASALLSGKRFHLLIGGKLEDPSDGAVMPSIDPALGIEQASIPDAAPADVERAVATAREAQPGWGKTPLKERQDLVLRIAAEIRARSEELAFLDSLDTGNVLAGMRQDSINAAEQMEYLAAAAWELKGESTQYGPGLHYTRREPFGVVARLLPFNHPHYSVGVALAAPLLMGNTVILKPSPHSAMSALAMGEWLAGMVPPGTISILSGGNARVSEPLIRHAGVDRLAIIGSTETGKLVARLAADRLAPVIMELGGKNPLIIFEDARVDEAVEIAVQGMNFRWQAHSCASTSRVLVHEALRAAFVEKLAERLSRIRVADPFAEGADMGAVSYKALLERCLGYVKAGREAGARLVTGGERITEPTMANGFYMRPALFDAVKPGMSIAREEIFGPVLSVLGWKTREEMLSIANGLDLGLTAVVLTDDLETALRTAEDLRVGYVEVNGPVSYALGSPIGGMKQSGHGREGSVEELAAYTQLKSVNVRFRRSLA